MTQRRRVVITGRVQGVGFRDACRRTARHHGVAGWVHNLADGTVEAVFEGPLAALEAMISWCHHGPPLAAVTAVATTDETPEALVGFELRR
jgi:acylphosphatase